MEPSYNTTGVLSISSNGIVFSVCPTGAGSVDNPEYFIAKFSTCLLIFNNYYSRSTVILVDLCVDFFPSSP